MDFRAHFLGMKDSTHLPWASDRSEWTGAPREFLVGFRQRPLQALETSEIAIKAEDSRPVLNGQRSKMRIRCEITGRTDGSQQTTEHLRMPLAGLRHLSSGMFKPPLDDAQGVVYRERSGKDAAAGAQAQKSQKHRPRKRHAARIVETLLQ
jgi:hypothetical protein